MRKLLLLGGSAQQVIAIETAKRLGYYTVLCDYLEDNPGQYVADRFYSASTTDKDAVLQIAKREKIDGIVAYASDPAAPTAAYVAEKLGLPTNPYESVELLSEKHKFRKFLAAHGFNCPRTKWFVSSEGIEEAVRNFRFPVMVKPADSSGSKGITKVERPAYLKEAFSHAARFSRCKIIVVEEYIEKSHPFIIGGDIFVVDGKIVFWGLLNCHRDERVNPLVPVGKSWPALITENQFKIIQQTEQRLMDLLNIRFGAFNVEMIFDENDSLFLIENGPRNGGNMIPDLLRMITGVDMVEATVQCAMGVRIKVPEQACGQAYYATLNLHVDRDGIFRGVRFSEKIKPHIVGTVMYKKNGDNVEFFDGANKALGILFMKFDSQACMLSTMDSIYNEIQIICE